MFTII